jgi:hypothetical protein
MLERNIRNNKKRGGGGELQGVENQEYGLLVCLSLF